MTTVKGRLLRSVGFDSFADLTPVKVTRIDAAGIHFAATLPADVAEKIRERIESRDDTDATIRKQAKAAHASNAAFIADVVPGLLAAAQAVIDDTAATTREQSLARAVKALTTQADASARHVNALIRLAGG